MITPNLADQKFGDPLNKGTKPKKNKEEIVQLEIEQFDGQLGLVSQLFNSK